MLLQALNEFYDRATVPDSSGESLIQEAAFVGKYIRWVIPLDLNGNLVGGGLIENPEPRNNGRIFSVPRTSRPKNAGGVAEFLWDSIEGIFCLKPDIETLEPNEKKRESQDANRQSKFDDFWRQIEEGFRIANSPSLNAVLKFRENYLLTEPPVFLRWGSLKEDEKPSWLIKTANESEEKFKADSFTFQVNGKFPFEDEELRDFWRNSFASERSTSESDSEKGLCLVTGASDVAISASHLPKIGGVPGATPTGAALVSFDKDSFCSYGLDKSYNSPISFQAVEGYTNALNFLLAKPQHRLKIGDTALLFWAQKSEEATDMFAELFDEPKEETIRRFMTQPFRGATDVFSLEQERFYSVTLGGNSGRVVVRNWMQMTVKDAVANFQTWFRDLEIVSLRSHENDKMPPLNLFLLARSTVREAKDLRAEVPTQLYRCALEGHAPSLNILKNLVDRIAIDLAKDGKTSLNNLSRFALLKLIVNRNRKENEPIMDQKLNNEIDDYAYNCGRLLAVFEELQSAAHEYKLEGASVVERYYGTASSSPNSAFGILWRLHQHHLRKVSRNNPGKAEAIKQKIAEISTHFKQTNPKKPPQFPRSFNLQGQGRFALGFYQQIAADRDAREAYFKSKQAKKEGESINEQ